MAKEDGERRSLFGRPTRPQAPTRGSPPAESEHFAAVELQAATLRLNTRAMAAQAARQMLHDQQASPLLQTLDVGSRPPTMAEIVSPWFAYWARELQLSVRPERRLWGHIAVLQAFYEAGVLRAGAKVLGFGVGDEPLASYLAALGLEAVASDLPQITDRARVLHPQLVEEADFDARVEVSDIDLSQLNDSSLGGMDGCWSCGVINELDTVHHAEEAVIDAMDVLRPGGIAVHVTDLAFAPDEPRQEPGQLRFPAKFFEDLARGLTGRGHAVAPLSFELGRGGLDAYVDLEPTRLGKASVLERMWRAEPDAPQLKVALGDALATSFVLIVRRRP